MRCGAAVSTTASRDLAGCSGSFKPFATRGAWHHKKIGRTTKMRTNSRLRRTGIIAAMLAPLCIGWHQAAAQEPIAFKAGISDPVNTVLAWYMARDAGFYSALGLKLDIVNMNGGS